MIDYPALLAEAKALKPWLVQNRRALHKIPEPGDQEIKTQSYVKSVLDELGIPYVVRRTSIVALIQGGRPGPVVALRADMDALPVTEPEDRPYRSGHEGYMHACGHDAHMTVALGAARVLNARRATMAGSIKLLFQPAEETTGGAVPMIADGCLENPHVDYVIGLHVMPDVLVGKVELKHGAINAASDFLGITVKGKGCHAAYPHTGIDSIVAAAQVISALQTVVSRTVSPLEEAVVTLGTIAGGTQNNIVAGEVRLTGTLRTTNPQVREVARARIRAIVEGVCQSLGAEGELEIVPGYSALVNHDSVVDLIAQEAEAILGKAGIVWKEKPSMGAEDFAFFLQERPGAFYNLGCGNPEKGIGAALHARNFDIDEDCLPIGVAVQAASALRLLAL
ncbi:MAG: amidohydrolase [Spirochaetes bacterium]|nr:MAG: amidohydrolase [Spirochaetota bacterium]